MDRVPLNLWTLNLDHGYQYVAAVIPNKLCMIKALVKGNVWFKERYTIHYPLKYELRRENRNSQVHVNFTMYDKLVFRAKNILILDFTFCQEK